MGEIYKTKGEKIAHIRDQASQHAARKRGYAIVQDWAEEGAGTDKYEVTVTLKKGNSFRGYEHCPKACFSSTNDAMSAIRNNTYKCNCDLCKKFK